MSHAQRGMIARRTNTVRRVIGGVACVLGLAVVAPKAQAQDASGTTFDLYGFVMADMIFEFGQSNPDWFDTVRPSKLPSVEDEYGKDGRFYAGVRQSKIGAKTSTPTGLGTLKTLFEFDLFGVGVDAGQTTIRPRHMWGEIGEFGAGQTDSPFMDGDVFPNILEYWGPAGMLYYRQPQVRWMPIRGNDREPQLESVDRARASRRQRRSGRATRTASSSRTSARASRCRTSRPSTGTARSGAMSSSRESSARCSSTICWWTSSTWRRACSAGASASARTTSPPVGRGSFPGRLRRRDPELLQRCAGGRRSQAQHG